MNVPTQGAAQRYMPTGFFPGPLYFTTSHVFTFFMWAEASIHRVGNEKYPPGIYRTNRNGSSGELNGWTLWCKVIEVTGLPNDGIPRPSNNVMFARSGVVGGRFSTGGIYTHINGFNLFEGVDGNIYFITSSDIWKSPNASYSDFGSAPIATILNGSVDPRPAAGGGGGGEQVGGRGAYVSYDEIISRTQPDGGKRVVNNGSPGIAVDSRGNVYIAWSTGNISKTTYYIPPVGYPIQNIPPYWNDHSEYPYVGYTEWNWFANRGGSWPANSVAVDSVDNVWAGIGDTIMQRVTFTSSPYIYENIRNNPVTGLGSPSDILDGMVCCTGSNTIQMVATGAIVASVPSPVSFFMHTPTTGASTTYVCANNAVYTLYTDPSTNARSCVLYTGSTAAGNLNGSLLNARYTGTTGFAVSDSYMYVSHSMGIRQITPAYVNRTFATYSNIAGIAIDVAQNLYVSSGSSVFLHAAGAATATAITGFTQPTGITIVGGIIYVADKGVNKIYKVTKTGNIYVVSVAYDNIPPSSTSPGAAALIPFTQPTRFMQNPVTQMIYILCAQNIIQIAPSTSSFSEICVISKNSGRNVALTANLYGINNGLPISSTTLAALISGSYAPTSETGVSFQFLEIDLGIEHILDEIIYYLGNASNLSVQNINVDYYNDRRYSVIPTTNFQINNTPIYTQSINPVAWKRARYVVIAGANIYTSQIVLINAIGLNAAFMRMSTTPNPTDGTYSNQATTSCYLGGFTLDLGMEYDIMKVVYYNSVTSQTGSTGATITLLKGNSSVAAVAQSFIGGLASEVFDYRLSTSECGLVNLDPSTTLAGVRYITYNPEIATAIRQIMVYDKSGTNIALGCTTSPVSLITDGASATTTDETALFTGYGNVATLSLTPAATLSAPSDIVFDSAGNMYIADKTNNRIIKQGASTQTIWSVTTPTGLTAPDALGNIYSTSASNRIYKTTSVGNTTILAGSGTAGYADGISTAAHFNAPTGIIVGPDNYLYVADKGNHCIRKVDRSTGATTTFAGAQFPGNTNGSALGTYAAFNVPQNILVVTDSVIYVSEWLGGSIRKISGGNTTTFMPSSALGATPYSLGGMATNTAKTTMYFANYSTHAIYSLALTAGATPVLYAGSPGVAADLPQMQAQNLAGTGSAGTEYDNGGYLHYADLRQLNIPQANVIDNAGNIYVADRNNNLIRKITPAGVVSILAGGGAPLPPPGYGGLAYELVNGVTKQIFKRVGIAAGSTNGIGTNALFKEPIGLAFNPDKTILYVADFGNSMIRAITISTGNVTTLAGVVNASWNLRSDAVTQGSAADGPGTSARFYGPTGMCTDSAGNIYVGEWYRSTIRKITPAGVVTTIAGTIGVSGFTTGTGVGNAQFNTINDVKIDALGNLIVSDNGSCSIRKVTLPTGAVSTIAGTGSAGYVDGSGNVAQFINPVGVAIDSSGNILVADYGNNVVRKIDTSGVVSTCNLTANPTNGAAFISFDASQNAILSDIKSSYVRKITNFFNNSDFYTTKPRLSAKFNNPIGLTADSSNNLYVIDKTNKIIRVINTTTSQVSVLIDSSGNEVNIDDDTTGIAINSVSNVLYIANNGATRANITKYEVSTKILSVIAGGNIDATPDDGVGAAATFNNITGITIDANGYIYIADGYAIRRLNPTDNRVTTIAGSILNRGYGDGVGTAARFSAIQGIDADSAGNLYICDGNRIRKMSITGTPLYNVVTFTGATKAAASMDGPNITSAMFDQPTKCVFDLSGNMYVADSGNKLIRVVTPTTTGASTTYNVTTFAGSTTAEGGVEGYQNGPNINASFSAVGGMTISQQVDVSRLGNRRYYILYISDTTNNIIRAINLESQQVVTIAGVAGVTGNLNTQPRLSKFSAPTGIAINANTLYIVDTGNNVIRTIAYPSTNQVPITLDLGAPKSITGMSIITTPGYTTTLAGAIVTLKDGSQNTMQQLTLKGGMMREDLVFNYCNNTMARYIRIQNPAAHFFDITQYIPPNLSVLSGRITIASFQAFDIYGRNLLTGKTYRAATTSNYSTTPVTTFIDGVLKTNAEYVEYDLGKEYAIFSVKFALTLPATTLDSQNIDYRFMTNAPIIFYNEARAQTGKYFLTSPYVPQSLLLSNSYVPTPLLQVLNIGNFKCDPPTASATRISVGLNEIYNAQSITFKVKNPGLLSWNFTNLLASGGITMTITGLASQGEQPNPRQKSISNGPQTYIGRARIIANEATIKFTLLEPDMTQFRDSMTEFMKSANLYFWVQRIEANCITAGYYSIWKYLWIEGMTFGDMFMGGIRRKQWVWSGGPSPGYPIENVNPDGSARSPQDWDKPCADGKFYQIAYTAGRDIQPEGWMPFYVGMYKHFNIVNIAEPFPVKTTQLSQAYFDLIPPEDITTSWQDKYYAYVMTKIHKNYVPNDGTNYIQIDIPPPDQTNIVLQSVSATLYPDLLAQQIPVTYPVRNVPTKETTLTGVQYIIFNSTQQFTLNQLVVINHMGINVAVGKAVWITLNSQTQKQGSQFIGQLANFETGTPNGVNCKYNTTIPGNCITYTIDLGDAYNISAISLYNFYCISPVDIYMYNSSAALIALNTLPISQNALAPYTPNTNGKISIQVAASENPTICSISFSSTSFTCCQPQGPTIGRIARYITISVNQPYVVITDTAGHIIYNDQATGRIDLGEEHNIASILVQLGTQATLQGVVVTMQDAWEKTIYTSPAQNSTNANVILNSPSGEVLSTYQAYTKAHALLTFV
jgi:sugar lactone lactonase YvrE